MGLDATGTTASRRDFTGTARVETAPGEAPEMTGRITGVEV
jgi:hypothetical protein